MIFKDKINKCMFLSLLTRFERYSKLFFMYFLYETASCERANRLSEIGQGVSRCLDKNNYRCLKNFYKDLYSLHVQVYIS